MTASRTDLLAWLNELLQINYTKVEQCGAGGAYCQILDSVYGASTNFSIRSYRDLTFQYSFSCLLALWRFSLKGDLPMNRVKMNAKHEYEYLANFKVMQNVFKAKKIDKVRLLMPLPKTHISDTAGRSTAYTSGETHQMQNAVCRCRPILTRSMGD